MIAERLPLELPPHPYLELKDPCPVYDGRCWHLFGTGVREDCFEVFHATAPRVHGPWSWEPPVDVSSLTGSCLAAPGVVPDGPVLHMFQQTAYNELGSVVEHLISTDGGQTFDHARTALTSLPGTNEAGIYDPHPFAIGAEKYLSYSAFSVIGQPDIHLARSASGTWDGPWERLGTVLRHEEVWCHNQRGVEAYEWGLEGAQVQALPDGGVLLNGVCFLPGAVPGARQRVFVAVAEEVTGPWDVLGPLLPPLAGENAGENGHAALVEDDGELLMFLQERSLEQPRWDLALARLDADALSAWIAPLDEVEVA
jgi:hypothetical protein